MEAKFSVTIQLRNSSYRPWNHEEEYNYNDHDFETWEDACAFARKIRAIWEPMTEKFGYESGTWEDGNGIHWALCKDGSIQCAIEIYPTPEDGYDDLPW